MNTTIHIHKYIPISKVEGPGKRFVLWVQGCSIQCKNCFVQHTWKKEEGKEVLLEDLYNDIIKYKDDIEGITVFGGEPFDQSESLFLLLDKIKKTSDLSVMVFSGYTIEHLKKSINIYNNKLLSLCDIFVDGPYIEKLRSTARPWVGSSNQRYFYFTDRYKYLENNNEQVNKLEVRIKKTGEVVINGLADKETLHFLEELI